jgi:hypothetical protein
MSLWPERAALRLGFRLLDKRLPLAFVHPGTSSGSNRPGTAHVPAKASSRRLPVPLSSPDSCLPKTLGVPARDAMGVLGHSRVTVALEVYTDSDDPSRKEAIGRVRYAVSTLSCQRGIRVDQVP